MPSCISLEIICVVTNLTLFGDAPIYRARQEAPDSIRAQFGLTDTRNAAHGSGLEISVNVKLSFFSLNLKKL